MRIADYVMSFLAERGVEHAFLVTGGGAMHLNDAVGREKRLRWVCCHHEQACAIAAESYARLSGRVALVNVTTGPGGVNALNGVYGAWVDSIPMFVVSGQVKRETIAGNTGLPLRQLGDQEIDIVAMARSVTKYAVCVQDPATIRYHLEKAWHLATSGRPGPVWIDVPIDVQAAPVEPAKLEGFSAEAEGGGRPLALPAEAGRTTGEALDADVREVVERLARAERPVLLAGAGVRLAGARDLLLRVAEKLGVPLTTGWNAHDLVPNAHPCYAGRPGSMGDRQGNFTVQNADLLLVLGSRLNVRQISYNWKTFARGAYRVMVDVDTAELRKPTLAVDKPIHADVREFLERLDRAVPDRAGPRHAAWMEWCRERGRRYPVVLAEYERAPLLNPYVFMRDLFEALPEDAVVVTGDGTACVVSFQAGRIKSGTRLYTNSGCASMGYDLPAAIGAHVAAGRPVFCLAGDGSVMMNLQELQTIAGRRLPVRDLRPQQRRLLVDPPDPAQLLPGKPDRHRPGQRRHVPRLRAARRGARHPRPALRRPGRPRGLARLRPARGRPRARGGGPRPGRAVRPEARLARAAGRPHGVAGARGHGAVPLARGARGEPLRPAARVTNARGAARGGRRGPPGAPPR